MKKLIVGIAAAVCTTSSFAWGDREQGALAGIVGTLILLNQQRQEQVIIAPQPRVIEREIYVERHRPLPPPPSRWRDPANPYCYLEMAYDRDGAPLGYMRICR